ncbi:hypothetical protein TNCV_3507301 [Trichonephila clavipes]|uniref:Uncharacterized protein n=1 Tax=Trichonephila clavipes TaxID=2585209 RepID=A0A8X6S1H7_TRICX|nr:hypothetical protein TNCV_3507301 [Trichonephila clavipes]
MKEANDVLDRALYFWFSQRSKGAPITGLLWCEKGDGPRFQNTGEQMFWNISQHHCNSEAEDTFELNSLSEASQIIRKDILMIRALCKASFLTFEAIRNKDSYGYS